MQVGDLMKTDVKTATPDETFADAARLLHEHAISSVIVMDGQNLAGIVTERDLVNLVAEGQDPASTKLADRMTRDLDTVKPKTDVAEAAEHMARLRIRHLPVVERGKLVGIVSIRDLTYWAVDELTGGHELADMQRGATALSAAAQVHRARP